MRSRRMDAERWQQINVLLDEVMELPSEQQRSYLESKCEHDLDLKQEVLSLLKAHGDASRFLEEPARDYAATLIDMADDIATDPLVGKSIDGYRILGVLGRGGMGIVYKAEDEALSRTVALKMIDPALARDESFVRRFRSEARALARIDSPNIVRVHALRQTEHGLFIVMEYVDGGTVSDLMRDGPVAWRHAKPLVRQMLTALEHAHSVGVVHRDIKPGNIMLSASGRVKVTDFGLAKLNMGDGNRTVTQGIAGTLYYMSPEQVKGLQDLDHRSDLYSMGMTIYQMLAGELPIDRDSGEFAIMRSIVEESFPPITSHVSSVPRDVSDAIMRSLAKEPDDRFQTAAEMRSVLTGDAEPARNESATIVESEPYRPAQPSSDAQGTAGLAKNRYLMMGGGATAILLVVVLAYMFWPSGGTSTGRLSIVTSPEGATVLLGGAGGKTLGTAPLMDREVDAEGDAVQVRVERDGYIPLDTTLALGTTHYLALKNAAGNQQTAPTIPTRAYLLFTSNERDAIVTVNGERIGRTPLGDTVFVPPGRIRVQVEKSGFRTWEETVDLSAGDVQRIPINLAAAQSTPPETPQQPQETATASLTLDVQPEGSVQVSGERCTAGSACTVSAGTKDVTFTHPEFGSFSERVTVGANDDEKLTFHFVQPLAVQVRRESGGPIWGTIQVDDAPGVQLSDKVFPLGPGSHRVNVERSGFEVVRVEKDGNPVSVGPQTIDVTPGFEERTHRLVFYIREQ